MINLKDLPPMENAKKEDPVVLRKHLASFETMFNSATLRKQHVQSMMQRKSAKRWDATKKARMVRKLMTADIEIERATQAIHYFRSRLDEEHG